MRKSISTNLLFITSKVLWFYIILNMTTTCEMQCVAITRNRNEIKIPPHQNKNKTNKC